MKKFTLICCGLTALLLILSFGLIMIAPATIDIHITVLVMPTLKVRGGCYYWSLLYMR